MTEHKIKSAVRRISDCKKTGARMEAMIRQYHLNVRLLRYLCDSTSIRAGVREKKPKAVVREFIEEHPGNTRMRSLISRKSLKAVKLWLRNADGYLKGVRVREPKNTSSLLQESESVFTLLHLPARKLLLNNNGPAPITAHRSAVAATKKPALVRRRPAERAIKKYKQ